MLKILLVDDGLTGYGLVGELLHASSGQTIVWILSSSVTPQPSNTRGIWLDNGVFVDANVWYD